MKVFVLAGFLGIGHTFSKNIEYIHRRSILLKSPLNLLDSISEENILAIILKEDVDNKDRKCETGLKEYCKSLQEIDPNLDKVHPKIKGICKNNTKIQEKCKNLKNELIKNCNTFKTKLGELYVPSYDDCKENEQKCLFLEGACSNLLMECSILRNKCYQKKRDKVAKEILLRALDDALENACVEKLKKICIKLNQESDELMYKCFDPVYTCTILKKEAKEICDFLKTRIEIVFEKNTTKTCVSLLERCHFHWKNCETQEKPNCDELKIRCGKKGIIYTPPTLNFDPMNLEITLIEKINLKKLYEEAIADGIYIGKPPTRDIITLLALLIYDISYFSTNIKDRCDYVLKQKCKDFNDYLNLKDLCNGNNANDKGNDLCKKLEKELETRTRAISEKINKVLLTNNSKDLISWYKLKTFLTEKDCVKLLSDCHYFKDHTSIKKQCDNLKAACYKKGLEGLANKALQKKMRGMLHGSGVRWLETLQKELINVCVNLERWSDELFVLCVHPKETALTVSTDLRMRAIALREHFNEKRLYPTKNDCEELEEKCEDLKQDSKEIEWLCYALNQHCDRLRSIEQLEKELLEENKGYLKDEKSCVEEAKKRCEMWLKKENSKFSPACSALELSCRKITRNVRSNCTTLEEHIKATKILDKIDEENKADEICKRWTPYCEKLMPNCKILERKETCDGECKKLNDKCESFLQKKKLENKLIDKFKGSLSSNTDCITILNKYCRQLTNKTNENFCTNITNNRNNTKVKEELCERLLKRVQEKCSGLRSRLIETNEELKEKDKEYKNIKKEAKKAMGKANLVLSISKISSNESIEETVPNLHNQTENELPPKLIRRDLKVDMTEKELLIFNFTARAFSLVAKAFDFYLELKEICQYLVKECEFEKECKFDDLCREVKNICLKLKPLKIKTKEVTTVIQNTTVITRTEEKEKTVTKEKQCTLFHTTDIWITHTLTNTTTSTQTSIITSTIILISTEQCKPAECTTEEEIGELWPNEGFRMNGWSVIKMMLIAIIISTIV